MAPMLVLEEEPLHPAVLNATVPSNQATVQLAHQDHPDSRDYLAMTARAAKQETQDWPEPTFTHNTRKKAALSAQLEKPARPDLTDHQDQREKTENQDKMGNQEKEANKEPLDQLVMPVPQDLTEPLADQDNQAATVNVIAQFPDQKDPTAHQDHQDNREPQANNHNQALQAPPDPQEHRAAQVKREATESRAQLVNPALQAPTPLTVHAHPALKTYQSRLQRPLVVIANVVFEWLSRRITKK